MESTSYVLSFRMVFLYHVTTGWIFDISLVHVRIQSINQSINVEEKPTVMLYTYRTEAEAHDGGHRRGTCTAVRNIVLLELYVALTGGIPVNSIYFVLNTIHHPPRAPSSSGRCETYLVQYLALVWVSTVERAYNI